MAEEEDRCSEVLSRTDIEVTMTIKGTGNFYRPYCIKNNKWLSKVWYLSAKDATDAAKSFGNKPEHIEVIESKGAFYKGKLIRKSSVATYDPAPKKSRKISEMTDDEIKEEMEKIRKKVESEYGWLHKNKRYVGLQNERSRRGDISSKKINERLGLYDPSPKRCEPSICKALGAKGISCDLVDIPALIDSELSCDENKKAILKEVGASKTKSYKDYDQMAQQYYQGQGKLINASPAQRAAAFARMREDGTLRGYDPSNGKYSVYHDGKLFANESDKKLAKDIYKMLVRTYPNTKAELIEWKFQGHLTLDSYKPVFAQKAFEKDNRKKAHAGKKLKGQQSLTSAVSTSKRLSDYGVYDPAPKKEKKISEKKSMILYAQIRNIEEFIEDVKKGDYTVYTEKDLPDLYRRLAKRKEELDNSYTLVKGYDPAPRHKVKFYSGIPSQWYEAMVKGIKNSSDVRNPYAIVKNIWAKLSFNKRKEITQRAAKGEQFNYDLPLPDDRVTKGEGTLRMVKPFNLAEAQVNVSKKDMEAVKKSGIFKPMKRQDGTTCMVARCKSEKGNVNIFADAI